MLSLAAVATTCASLLSPLNAPVQPNLAGHWTMDAAKSTTTGAALPTQSTYDIVQHGDTLIVDRRTTSQNGALENHFVMLPNGALMPNTLAVMASVGGEAAERQEMPAMVKARWVNDTLVSTITADMHGNEVVLMARWSLSADGATLTEEREGTMNGTSNGSQVVVFRKK